MRLRVPFGGGFRRARLNGRRVRTDCVACCSDSPWYIRAFACYYGTLSGSCASIPKPDVWVCVNAITSNGQTVRERYGVPLPGRTFTFIKDGWCYTSTYSPLEDSGLTATEADAIASGLDRIACNESVNTIDGDCNSPLCPTGIGYVRATQCNNEVAGPEVYVCAGQVRRVFVTNINGICYCVRPGVAIDRTQIPPDALRFDRVFYPGDPNVVIEPFTLFATYRACCECVADCNYANLQDDPNRVCCCDPDAVLLSYVMDYGFIRTTIDDDGVTTVQTVTGRAAPGGTPALPVLYHWEFRSNGQLVQDGDNEAPFTDFWCGFNQISGFPPRTFVDYDPVNGGGFGIAQSLIRLDLNIESGDQISGAYNGTFNASCSSYALEIIGTVRNPDYGRGETVETRININATFSQALQRCRGLCGSVEQPPGAVFLTKPQVESIANPRELLP